MGDVATPLPSAVSAAVGAPVTSCSWSYSHHLVTLASNRPFAPIVVLKHSLDAPFVAVALPKAGASEAVIKQRRASAPAGAPSRQARLPRRLNLPDHLTPVHVKMMLMDLRSDAAARGLISATKPEVGAGNTAAAESLMVRTNEYGSLAEQRTLDLLAKPLGGDAYTDGGRGYMHSAAAAGSVGSSYDQAVRRSVDTTAAAAYGNPQAASINYGNPQFTTTPYENPQPTATPYGGLQTNTAPYENPQPAATVYGNPQTAAAPVASSIPWAEETAAVATSAAPVQGMHDMAAQDGVSAHSSWQSAAAAAPVSAPSAVQQRAAYFQQQQAQQAQKEIDALGTEFEALQPSTA